MRIVLVGSTTLGAYKIFSHLEGKIVFYSLLLLNLRIPVYRSPYSLNSFRKCSMWGESRACIPGDQRLLVTCAVVKLLEIPLVFWLVSQGFEKSNSILSTNTFSYYCRVFWSCDFSVYVIQWMMDYVADERYPCNEFLQTWMIYLVLNKCWAYFSLDCWLNCVVYPIFWVFNVDVLYFPCR